MRFKIQPLFFLPRSALRWAYDQAYFEHLMDTPFVLLFIIIDHAGIWFPYKGDEVLWTWPWRRREREGDKRGKAPFVSVGFSGNGDFGDARYWTLKELDADWEGYFAACERVGEACWDLLPESLRGGTEMIADEPLEAGDLVALTEDGKRVRKAT